MGNQESGNIKYGNSLQNDVKLNWACLQEDEIILAREGHTACGYATDDSKIVFVFGGVAANGDELSDLLSFNSETGDWKSLNPTGDIPHARSNSSLSAVGKNLYLFGGLSQNYGWFEDLHCYDIESNKWTKLKNDGSCPSGRDKVSSAVIGDCIYYFGGFGPKTDSSEPSDIEEEIDEDEFGEIRRQQAGAEFTWFNDLYYFDTVNKQWFQPMQMNIGGPTPRSAAGMCAVNNKLYIFGGRDNECRRNDLHIFDTETKKWDLEFEAEGRQPEPRSFHTVTAVGKRVAIIGGRGLENQHFRDVHLYDTETNQWIQPEISGSLPPECGCHTATEVGNKLVIYGGSSDFDASIGHCKKFHCGVYSLNTGDILSGGVTKVDDTLNTAAGDACSATPSKVNGINGISGSVNGSMTNGVH